MSTDGIAEESDVSAEGPGSVATVCTLSRFMRFATSGREGKDESCGEENDGRGIEWVNGSKDGRGHRCASGAHDGSLTGAFEAAEATRCRVVVGVDCSEEKDEEG